MSLDSGNEGVLDPDVELRRSGTEPAPASAGENRRLVDLREAEHRAVEPAGVVLTSGRSRDLNVMEPRDRRQRDARPSYSGSGLAATTTKVRPSGPADARRVDAASTRR